jgi:drug/metabolite transporter (DMT)-like permease
VVCIGFSAIFTKWATTAGPFVIPGAVSAFYRVAIATVVLALPFALHSMRRSPANDDVGTPEQPKQPRQRTLLTGAVWLTAWAGLFFALDLGLWNTSLRYTSAANATLLGNTSTLWVSIGAMLLFHEQLRRRFWLGMLIAVVGAVLIVGRDVFEHPSIGWGDLMAVGSSLFYAGYLLSTQRARQNMGTLAFMWVSSAVATVLLLAYVLAMGERLTGYSGNQYLSLAALGLISHVLGWMAINYSLGHLPAPLTSVTLLAQPVITAIIAVPLLNEDLSLYQIAGGLLVLLGIYTVNRR